MVLLQMISKAFLRIGLQEQDKDYTRFMWPSNPLEKESPGSENQEQELNKLYKVANQVMELANMLLQDWTSNSPLIKEKIKFLEAPKNSGVRVRLGYEK